MCMAFQVGQPCLRVIMGRYERAPYPQRACILCAGAGAHAQVAMHAMFECPAVRAALADMDLPEALLQAASFPNLWGGQDL